MKKAHLALLAAPLIALSFSSPAQAAGTYEQNSYRLGCGIAWFFGLEACAELLTPLTVQSSGGATGSW
jgi:hypothetical protein